MVQFPGNYKFIIQYHPEKDIMTADALSHLFIRSSTGDDGLNPDWPMIYNITWTRKSRRTSPKTQNLVIKNLHLFVNENGVILRRLNDGNPTPYNPCLPEVQSILRYHHGLSHTKACNLAEFLRFKVWWPSLAHGVQIVFEHFSSAKKSLGWLHRIIPSFPHRFLTLLKNGRSTSLNP